MEGGSDFSGGRKFGGGPDAEDIFNRADGLDEVLLDLWVELESGLHVRKMWTYIVRSQGCGSRPREVH